MKKLVSLLVVLAMMCTLFAACGGGGSEETTAASEETAASEAETTAAAEESTGKTKITVLRPGDQDKIAPFLEPAIEQFEADNPDIDVEIMYESWAGWIQTYSTYFEADTQPDVIFWWDNKLHDSSAEASLVDLSPYLSDELISKIPESVWNMVDPGDMEGLYYVPSSVDTFVLYYNYEVFEAAGLDPESPPTTWEELLTCAEQIATNTGIPGIGVPGITGSEVLEEFVGMFINQATQADVLDTSSYAQFNNDKGQEALSYLEDLFKYAQESPTEYGRGELRSLLRDGQVGMIIDGPWAVSTFQAAWGNNFTEEGSVGVAAVPQHAAGETITWAGTNGWIASRESTAEASAKLIEYLMSDDVLEAHHLAYGSSPLYESEFENESFGYEYWKTMYQITTEYTMFGMIGRNSATPSAYYTALEEVWQQLLLGQIGAEDAMAAAVDAVATVTARNE